jgi:hypothetical protein
MQKRKELEGRKPYHEVVLGPNPRPVTRGVARDAAHRGAEHVHDARAAAIALQLLHVPAKHDARTEQPDAAWEVMEKCGLERRNRASVALPPAR